MNDYDFIIAGAGAGGASLARELSMGGARVLVVERGPRPEAGVRHSAYSDKVVSAEGVPILRALAAGGTTLISAGCSVPALEKELLDLGINIANELLEVEQDCGVIRLPEKLLSNRSRAIRDAARDEGVEFVPMPKALDPLRCNMCGACMSGCPQDAMWSSLDTLDEAISAGATVLYDTEALHVVVRGGRACGLEVRGVGGEKTFGGGAVVLAAGALETPVLLNDAGISEAGGNLSVDLLCHVYGLVEGKMFENEPTMPMVAAQFHDSDGYILSPNVNLSMVRAFIDEHGLASRYVPDNALGIMIKIADQQSGKVFSDGSVSKAVSGCDNNVFERAKVVAKAILARAGAEEEAIFATHVNGAHPAGTAAIGRVVSKSLETRIKGLYVCDASLLPKAPGLPTIEVIMALSKYLSKLLLQAGR